MDTRLLASWLKAGYIERKTFHATEEGTPQGGIISPTLCNMTLDGLEAVLKARFKRCKVNLIRYADDFIVTGESEALLREEVKPVVEAFLAERGRRRSEAKTRIVHIEEGVDVLGQNIRQDDGKWSITPAQKAGQKGLDNIRGLLKQHTTAKPATLSRRINPVLRGGVSYHRHVCRKKTFAYGDFHIRPAVAKWAKRRHPKQSKTWSKARDFTSQGGHTWECTGTEATGQALHLLKAAATPLPRHVTGPGKANPYDPA